ncbi:hypothetical protein K439DRAFT_1613891 [Ramaria rubella]|nr:hypothetical protein K439DRAFT_1613891 [Ramaria rubella]
MDNDLTGKNVFPPAWCEDPFIRDNWVSFGLVMQQQWIATHPDNANQLGKGDGGKKRKRPTKGNNPNMPSKKGKNSRNKTALNESHTSAASTGKDGALVNEAQGKSVKSSMWEDLNTDGDNEAEIEWELLTGASLVKRTSPGDPIVDPSLGKAAPSALAPSAASAPAPSAPAPAPSVPAPAPSIPAPVPSAYAPSALAPAPGPSIIALHYLLVDSYRRANRQKFKGLEKINQKKNIIDIVNKKTSTLTQEEKDLKQELQEAMRVQLKVLMGIETSRKKGITMQLLPGPPQAGAPPGLNASGLAYMNPWFNKDVLFTENHTILHKAAELAAIVLKVGYVDEYASQIVGPTSWQQRKPSGVKELQYTITECSLIKLGKTTFHGWGDKYKSQVDEEKASMWKANQKHRRVKKCCVDVSAY